MVDDAETEDVVSLKCANKFPCCLHCVEFYQGCVTLLTILSFINNYDYIFMDICNDKTKT